MAESRVVSHELRLAQLRILLPDRAIIETVLDLTVYVVATLFLALIDQGQFVHTRMGRLLGLQLPEVEGTCSRNYRNIVCIRFSDRADIIHGLDQILRAIQIILLNLVH